MDARMSVLTLGAQDVLAMKQFYTQVLGWPVLAENNDIVFFKLNWFLLSICNKKSFSEFIGVDFNAAVFHPLTIGYNVASKEAVQSLYDSLKEKVNILKEPTEPPFGGAFFYFTDIEGNIIEVAYNPYVILDDDMNAIAHKPIDGLY